MGTYPAFAHRIGYLPFDVGAALKVPSSKDSLAERVLPETAVQRMLALEPAARNRAILEALYRTGMRVSELCALTWRDLKDRENGGQMTIYGKGGKTRVVFCCDTLWERLQELRSDNAGDNAPVFQSRESGPLSRQQVYNIVRRASKRAGIEKDVSPHWLRHAHASHALDRGVPVHVVQQTLGHADLSTTGRYAHVRPEDSSAHYLAE